MLAYVGIHSRADVCGRTTCSLLAFLHWLSVGPAPIRPQADARIDAARQGAGLAVSVPHPPDAACALALGARLLLGLSVHLLHLQTKRGSRLAVLQILYDTNFST